MPHPPALPSALALLLAVAPAPGGKGPMCYPTVAGARWVYTEGGVDWPVVVTEVQTGPDGSKSVAENWYDRDGKQVLTSRSVRVTPGELSVEVAAGVVLDTPVVFLKVGKPGDRWVRTMPGGSAVTTYTYRGTEKVEVPAGTFDAARVDSETTRDGKVVTRMSVWFAPGVGEVKSVTGAGHTRVLKSFTPGKD